MRTKRTIRSSPWLWISSALLGLALPAYAVDGVVEINHASALAGGVTSGDAPGYPVSIVGPGSYRLTGALTPQAGQSGIVITGSHATIDLNGFSIRGTAVCSGDPVSSCTAHGGDGIRHSVPADSGTVVRGGTIRGMDRGIALQATHSTVEDVQVSENQFAGIILTSQSSVERCRANRNGFEGIFLDSIGRIAASEANSNGGAGIAAGTGSIVTENRVFSNAGAGISVIAAGLVSRNVVQTNNISQNPVLGGIFANSLSVFLVRVENNVLAANGQGDLKGPALSSAGTNICTNVGC